ncbi:MAG: CZB domain-containing protein [Polyangiaceae bacterium]
MNLDEAIKSHTAWKLRLASFLQKPDGTLKEADVRADNKCALGQWIYGEGSAHSAMTEFAALKNDHAHFHRTAADVVKRAQSGARVAEEVALGAQSEFAQASSKVVAAISALKRKVG